MNIRSITGVQPTGSSPHIGNYFGAIKPFVDRLSADETDIMMIADYHAITVEHDPKTLRSSIVELAASMIACGVPEDALFQQSAVTAHCELAWILQSTSARMGWLQRMAQYKTKMAALEGVENAETPSVGLFTYPVLQAADILSYGAREVPVGEDQKQHLELTRDIAQRFNRDFGITFVVPVAVVTESGGRIMSLKDGSKKMSKSDPAETRIDLIDTPDVIAQKIKRATSDSALIPDTLEELDARPELTNLLTLYGLASNSSLKDALGVFAGKGYGALKPALTDALVALVEPIRARYLSQIEDRSTVWRTLNTNAVRYNDLANSQLISAKHAIGVL